MRRDEAVVLDIVEACRLIIEFRGSLNRAAFLKDLKTQSAVVHQLLIIGEAAKRLSDGFRSAHSDVPWRQVTGMRDRLIHMYDHVDLKEVWKTVTADIPVLLLRLEPLVPPRTS